MAASDKTVTLFRQASIFLQTEYEKLVERERQVQREMEQIKNIIERMQEQTNGNSSEKIQNLVSNGEKFVSDIENLHTDIRWQKPVIATALWKEAREQVKQVYTGIQEMPDKMKVAVRNKTYSIVDQAVQQTAFVFDKEIQYLQAKKEKVKMVEKQQPSVQYETEELKDRNVKANRDNVSNEEVKIKNPRKVLLRVGSKENVRSKTHEKERSL